ncbi:MAG TPA: Gfo/Idh/MocA family oxidoreductase [Isosphaeraceae bacterium]|jgi:predicted dehydrogenase|nr:Gfo/Idh/MocA family oxidoreductase [Isosphaeraceae bacterium]
MVNVGICGIGFMGMIHYLAYRRLVDAQVVALCSRDPKKLAGDWISIQGNFGPRGTQMDLSGQKGYADVGELLGNPQVDLVDLCVPNDEHARLAIRALEAGKHVLVEKPIALTTADADAMVAAAQASGRKLMVAHVLPFMPEFAFAREAVASGRYGALRAAHFMRVISKPDWSSGIADADRSGGPAIDLHIHDTHFIGLVCGVPRAVHSRGVVENGAVTYLTTQYLYDDPNLAVSAVSGALSQAGRPFAHGFELYLERATIAFEFASMGGEGHVATPLSVILPDGTIERPALGSGDPIDGFAAELKVAVGAVATGAAAPQLSCELARQALVLCHAEVESVKTRQPVALV